jgi:hypothetical protein
MKIKILFLFTFFGLFGLHAQNLYDLEHSKKFADYLIKTRQFDLGAIEYERLSFLEPNNDTLKIALINCYSFNKKYDLAINTYQQLWIEFKNVLGNNGWLFGSADFIAFERQNDFVLVARKNLITLCEKIVKKEKVSNPIDALYKTFSRKTRKDELSLIKMDDILSSTKTFIWPKE